MRKSKWFMKMMPLCKSSNIVNHIVWFPISAQQLNQYFILLCEHAEILADHQSVWRLPWALNGLFWKQLSCLGKNISHSLTSRQEVKLSVRISGNRSGHQSGQIDESILPVNQGIRTRYTWSRKDFQLNRVGVPSEMVGMFIITAGVEETDLTHNGTSRKSVNSLIWINVSACLFT